MCGIGLLRTIKGFKDGENMEQPTTLAASKKIAKIARTYCIMHDMNIKDYLDNLLEKDLKPFQDWLDKARKIE